MPIDNVGNDDILYFSDKIVEKVDGFIKVSVR